MNIFLVAIFSLLSVYVITNFKIRLIYKILLFPFFSIVSGFLVSVTNKGNSGSFAIFIWSGFATLALLSVFYPIFSSKFKNGTKEQLKEQRKEEIKMQISANTLWDEKWKK